MPNIRWLLALITRLHRFVYLVSDGWIGSRALSMHFLLLFHVGRKTGLERITPLLCITENDRWIVVASNAGDERAPAWLFNLQECPEAKVRFGRDRATVKAREASGAEYDAMWAKLQDSYASYATSRENTKREVPVIALERSGSE